MCIFKPKIPHPEEPFDPNATIENTPIDGVMGRWFLVYNVPREYWDYWEEQIVIEVDPDFPYPAGVWGENGIRHMTVQPGYFNEGVVAHEQAHNSYNLLTEGQKVAFANKHDELKRTNKLIKRLYEINTYGLTSDVEGHAEIYRYLHPKLPQGLESFYPKLF